MPAYTNANGKTVVAFEPTAKFKLLYASIEFQHDAKLDDGDLWPVGFAVTKFSEADKKRIAAILEKAAG